MFLSVYISSNTEWLLIYLLIECRDAGGGWLAIIITANRSQHSISTILSWHGHDPSKNPLYTQHTHDDARKMYQIFPDISSYSQLGEGFCQSFSLNDSGFEQQNLRIYLKQLSLSKNFLLKDERECLE